MAQQPTSSHPSLLRERKQSIVERAASAVEAKLSGSGVRRAATVPTVHHPMPQVTTQQHQQQPYADPVFSMNVDDYEIGPPIGMHLVQFERWIAVSEADDCWGKGTNLVRRNIVHAFSFHPPT